MSVTEEEKRIIREKYYQLITDASRGGDWPPEIVAAIMSRESRCGLALIPRKPGGNPAGTGDGGHGRGLMQIDDRAHPDFISSGEWKDPKENISYAMVVLNQSYKFLKKKTDLPEDDLRAAAIAGYNCGPGNVLKSLNEGNSWDARTTGGDYSEDVIARSAEFAEVFQAVPAVATAPVPAAGTAAPVPTGDTSAQFRVNAESLNLRSKPVVSPGSRIGTLARGHLVTKIGEDADPKWWKVDTVLRGIQVQGYAAHEYLIADQDYQAPAPLTGVVAVHLEENLPNVRRHVDSHQAYPLGEPNRPVRQGSTPADKARELTEIITWLDVEESARYQPNTRATFCNIYAYDYCYLAGAYIPRVWWNSNSIALLAAGEEVPVKYAKTVYEKNANSLYEWLEEFGEYFGWEPMDPTDLTALQNSANNGEVVVICAQNRDGNRSGHIAVVAPETEDNKAVWRQDGKVSQLLSSQAGRNNHNYWNPSAWWKDNQFRFFSFWKHA